MVAPFQGGCACKAIRYEVASEPFAVMECHCRDCQHASGGPSAVVAIVPRVAFKLTKGTPKAHTVKGDSGADVSRFFCADCGSPIYSLPGDGPIAAVKAGSLDDPGWLKLGGAIYVSSAQPWAHIDRNLPMFEKLPPGGG